jgi:predicted metal-dependent phosphoesterase TrpH
VKFGETMVNYDLHIHTTASDGLLTPESIFKIALAKGLKGIAITDHDTIDALPECELIASNYSMDFIPGIEISSDYKKYEIHILGYFIDYSDNKLLSFLDWLQQTREYRNVKMIELLQKLGYDVHYEEIHKNLDTHNKSIGRPHIARLLIEKGYFSNIKEVFDKLLGTNKPAYVNRQKVSIQDAARAILESKGIPIIAHPLINSKFNMENDFKSFIKYCVESGIMGIEVFHTQHNEEQEEYLFELAKKYKLIITGGSDCHGELIDGDYLLGSRGINSIDMLRLNTDK